MLSRMQGTRKGLFLALDNFLDKILLFKHFWIVTFHNLADSWHEFVKERLIDTQLLTVHRSATEQAAKHITTPFISRKRAVADCKGERANVVGNDLEAHIVSVLVVDLARQFLYFADNRHEKVGFKVSFSPLNNRHQALETCARINIFMRKFLVFATRHSRVGVELGQDDIPNFDIAVIFNIFCQEADTDIFRVKILTAVKENLRVWARRSRTDFPEIVLDRHEVAWVYSNRNPAVVRVLIVWIVGHVELVFGEVKPFWTSQEFVSPRNGLVAEIITD